MISDGHTPYPRAIAEVLGEAVVHKRRSGLANSIEQDHRGIKQRYYSLLSAPMLKGFSRAPGAF